MRPVKDLYKAAEKPRTEHRGRKRKGKEYDAEKVRFCLDRCPHPDKPCRSPCLEYKEKFKTGKAGA